MLPSPYDRGLGLRGHEFSGPPLRSLSLRPGDSLTIPLMALSMGFKYSVSLLLAIQATGSLALTLARLTLAEHASLGWTHVGSRTGAPTVGSGGSSKAFALGLSPAPLVTFPAPATSNPAYGFPVPGFPGCFAPRVMGPIRLRALSVTAGNHRAVAYSTSSAEAPTFSDSPRNARTVQPSPWRISSCSVLAD